MLDAGEFGYFVGQQSTLPNDNYRCKLNSMALSNLKIEELTRDQRLDLIEALWDSLDAEQFMLTEAQRDELDRRIDEMDRDNNLGIPWDEVLTRIRKRA